MNNPAVGTERDPAGGHYWGRTGLTRRRFLRATALTGVAAALAGVVACGDDASDSGGKKQVGFSKAEDTTGKAVRGGIFKNSSPIDIPTMDWRVSGSPGVGLVSTWVYSNLVKFKPGVLKRADGAVEGDLAESWEVSPDGLQLTMKLRGDAAWDQRAPTNGRAFDADDVVWTWNNWSKIGTRRTDLINSTSPDAPFVSLTAPDKRTVVFKLAFPDGTALPLLASTGHMLIAPREAEDKFDMKSEARGTGPWVISEYRPSTSINYRRNPNWYRKDRPFLDGFDTAIVPDYASQLSQFKAKNIWNHVATRNDVIQLKRDHPELLLLRGEFSLSWSYLQIGWEANTPFRDERVRQAASMAIDRDAFLETFENTKAFDEAGIPIETRYNTHLSSGWESYWLDPNAKDFGPNAKYFKFDAAEAKKLLAAAGYANGFDSQITFPGSPTYGADFVNRTEVMAGMLDAVGIRMKRNVVESNTSISYLPQYVQKPDRIYPGVASGAKAPSPDPSIGLYYAFASGGSRSVLAKDMDPNLDAQIQKMRSEQDATRRRTHIQDIQRYLAKAMWAIPHPGLSADVSLGWPWVMNQGVYYSWVSSPALPSLVYPNLWLDKAKMPS